MPIAARPSGGELAGLLGDMRRDRVHQAGRQAVVWLEAELLEPAADRRHLARRRAGFDDRRNEGRKLRRRPALVLRELGVNEVEAVERVFGVLDAAVHVHAATGTGV